MPDMIRKHFDVVVAGAGPAGLAAAASAGRCGARVAILDDNPGLGGQIWRGELLPDWIQRLSSLHVEVLCGTHAIHIDVRSRKLFAEGSQKAFEIDFSKLILATGARERFLPFPGWTLPNVMAAGGLQALVKSGLPIQGKRVVVAGSGPLLLAVAAYLCKRGANVKAICEQASWNALARFGLGLFRQWDKINQAWKLRNELSGVPFWPNCWPLRAEGSEVLHSVILSRRGKTHEIPCDYLACGFHLIPNIELASLIGCELRNDYVIVDDLQQTSVSDVFCAGEATGIGGIDRSLLEGQIAGLAATGQATPTKKQTLEGFARSLEKTFTLKPELKNLPDKQTIVCRCEDVTHAKASQYTSWRDAKNQTRFGMGPCQGRVCGPAAQFLYGWKPDSLRPPVFPARVATLVAMHSADFGGRQ